MNNLNKQEKSKGVLLFAFNSSINYVKIAEQSARLIKSNLRLPITLVTDTLDVNSIFDNVVVVDNNSINRKSAFDQSNWKNSDRYKAYDLSPYDITLMLDVDYLTLDNSLLKLFDLVEDYQIMKSTYTLDECWDLNMGNISLPYMWATVVIFQKTCKANQLFNLVGKIQRNYTYYRKLFNIREGNFRNDYAFTIANLILNGYQTNAKTNVPWSMLTIDKSINTLEYINDQLIIREDQRAHVISKQDIHIHDKIYLNSDKFKQFVDTICKE